MQKMLLVLMAMMMILSPISVYAYDSEEALPFPDIEGHWAEETIKQYADKGIVNGFPDGTFGPDKYVTTAEFIVMVMNSGTIVDENGVRDWSPEFLDSIIPRSKSNILKFAGNNFTHGNPWYQNYVDMAITSSVIGHVQYEGEYTQPLTREKASSIAVNFSRFYDGFIQNEYGDIAATIFKDYRHFSEMYARPSGKAAILGLIQGVPGGNFNPKGYLTRAEALTIISRIHDKDLRKPATIDLSPYPHAVVPIAEGMPDQIHIFASETHKQVYDTMLEAKDLTEGVYGQKSTTFLFFENEEKHDMYEERLLHFDGIRYFDVGIDVLQEGYFISISAVEGSVEKHYSVIDAFIKSIFEERAPTAQQFIMDNYNKVLETENITNYSVEKKVGKYTMTLSYVLREVPYFSISIREAN